MLMNSSLTEYKNDHYKIYFFEISLVKECAGEKHCHFCGKNIVGSNGRQITKFKENIVVAKARVNVVDKSNHAPLILLATKEEMMKIFNMAWIFSSRSPEKLPSIS